MTPDDIARLAQIAAWGLSRGEEQAAIEKRLGAYMSGIEDDDIADAMRAGWAAVLIPDYVRADNPSAANAIMRDIEEDATRGWRVLYRVRIGAGPDDWRAGAFRAGRGFFAEALQGEAEREGRELIGRISREGSDPQDPRNVVTPIDISAPDFGKVEIVYVAPY